MEQNTVSESNVVTEAPSLVLEQPIALDATTIADSADILSQLSESTIYMIGGSFVLGSLFTILILLLLDFMRRNKTDESK